MISCPPEHWSPWGPLFIHFTPWGNIPPPFSNFFQDKCSPPSSFPPQHVVSLMHTVFVMKYLHCIYQIMFFKEVCQMCCFSGRKHISTQCFHLVLFTCVCMCVCVCVYVLRQCVEDILVLRSLWFCFLGGVFCVRWVAFCLFWCWKRFFFVFVLLRFFYRRRQWHPTPVLLPGESQGRRSLVGFHPWGRTESDTTEAT